MYYRKYFLKLLIVISFSLTFSCSGNKNNLPGTGGQGRGMPTPVEVMVIKSRLLVDEFQTTGSIMPNEVVELRNEVAGRVTGIFFDEGARVPEGKLLLKINDSELKAQLDRIEAQVMLIEQDEYRKRQLLGINAISQEEYDVSLNQLKSVQADKNLLKAQIAKTEIYAPFSGRIGLRHASPGSYLTPNSLIATFQQTDPVKVEFTISERYAQFIKPGILIKFSVENSNEEFEGRIYAVEPSINMQTRTITARALSQNPDGLLFPGSFARISLVLQIIDDALLIPSEALKTEIDGSFILLYNNGRARSVKVETGIRTSHDIQITRGLQSGDSLITTGLLHISDGTLVTPRIVSEAAITGDEQEGQ